jgi:hypothetical protein
MAALLSLLAFTSRLGFSASQAGLASVSGRVNLDHHPVGRVMICFDSGGAHHAEAISRSDGSFQLHSFGRGDGAAPGKYRVHLASIPYGPSIPAKYQDPATSELDVEVGLDWNDFSFNLR